ncbi:RHS repeat-associated core domain-containing protein [Chitinophagaceae bacterium MMS25-I14]
MILERTTVHVSDDSGRIAMVETRTQGMDDSPQQLSRYIYGNHLGSATLELDESGETISYEEYHPYGTTAYQANNADINAVARRYRYTGKERDEESGLYYHGARYYIPWLCRWSAVDPKEGERATLSPYDCSNNPVNRTDPDGMKDGDWHAPMAAPAQANYATAAGYGQAGFADGRGSVLNPFPISNTDVVAKRKANVVDNTGHAAWITPAMVDQDAATQRYQNETVLVSDINGGGNIGPRQQMQWKVNNIATEHSEEVGDKMANNFFGSQAYAASGGDERYLDAFSVLDAGLMFASGKTGAPYGKTG